MSNYLIKTYLLFVLIIIVAIGGCTIKQVYHFNEDFSGISTTSIDMSLYKSFSDGHDTSNNESQVADTVMKYTGEIKSNMENLPGIKGVKAGYDSETGLISISYNFESVEALNNAIRSLAAEKSTSLSKGTETFIRKGNKLFYKIHNKESNEMTNSEEMESMKEYFKYQLVFSFDKEIKKVNNSNFTIAQDRKSTELNCSISEMLSPDFNTEIIIKLKR